jgi:hypothetical protein
VLGDDRNGAAGGEARAVGHGRGGGAGGRGVIGAGAVRCEDVRDGGQPGHGRGAVVGARRRREHLRGVGPAGARHDPAPALLQARQLRVLRQAAQHLRESQHNSPFTTHTSASSILRLPSSHLC